MKVRKVHLLDPVTNQVTNALCIIPEALDILFNDGKSLQQKYDSGELFIPTGYGLNLIEVWDKGIDFVKSEERVDLVPYKTGLYACKCSHTSTEEITPLNGDFWIELVPPTIDIIDQTGSYVKLGEEFENAEKIELFLKSTDNETIEICDASGRSFMPITDAKIVNYNGISLAQYLKLTNTLLDNKTLNELYNKIKEDSESELEISDEDKGKRINIETLSEFIKVILNEMANEETKVENMQFKKYTKQMINDLFNLTDEEIIELEKIIDDEKESTTKTFSSSKISSLVRNINSNTLKVSGITVDDKTPTNVQSALEVIVNKLDTTFQSADSFRSGICNAIGEPITTTDTKDQIITKVNTMKSTLSNSIKYTEGSVSSTASLNSLINTIADLNKKKYKVQTGTVFPFMYSSTGIDYADLSCIYGVNMYTKLSFIPKTLILYSISEYHKKDSPYGEGYSHNIFTMYNLNLTSLDGNIDIASTNHIIAAYKTHNYDQSQINTPIDKFTTECTKSGITFTLKKLPLMFSYGSLRRFTNFPITFIAIK